MPQAYTTVWMRHATYRIRAHVVGVHQWAAARQPRPRIRRMWRSRWTKLLEPIQTLSGF